MLELVLVILLVLTMLTATVVLLSIDGDDGGMDADDEDAVAIDEALEFIFFPSGGAFLNSEGEEDDNIQW